MENKVIAEGKTTNEAIENGLKILKVSKNRVNIKVLESEDKRSFFSILAPRVVKVELTLKEQEDKAINKEIRVKKEIVLTQEEQQKAKENIETFIKDMEGAMDKVGFDSNMLHRSLNSGFSGGNNGIHLIGVVNLYLENCFTLSGTTQHPNNYCIKL